MRTMAPKGGEVDELSTSNGKALFAVLIASIENGQTKRGMKAKVATFFKVAPRAAGRTRKHNQQDGFSPQQSR